MDSVNIAHMCDDPLSLTVDPVMMAKYDLAARNIPCVVVRSFPNGRVEYIPLQELLVDEEMLDLRV
ncbi:hypothetical protein AGDE_00782 [Angomonas deanei]|nr:hypothetical protein AGDE_00782 [Angomonas deanei]|eukprot:EPY43140.1 hypothetical protein AGDE_00782 [Angomonas deanei]